MRKKHVYIFIVFITIIACKSYEPFSNKEEKKLSRKLIKKEFSLTDNEYDNIKNEDSVLFLVARSLKSNVKHALIERRLDSFFVTNYTRKELLLILDLDYNFPKQRSPFEFNRRKNADGIEFKDMKQLKKFFNKGGYEKTLDSLFGMKKKDSTNKKQH